MTETVGDKTYEVEEEIDRISSRSTGRTSLGKEVSSSGEDKVATRQREQKISTLETKKRGLEAKIMARHKKDNSALEEEKKALEANIMTTFKPEIDSGVINLDKILKGAPVPKIKGKDTELITNWKEMARKLQKGSSINLDAILAGNQEVPVKPRYDSYGDPIPNAFVEDKDVLEWITTARELESVFDQTGRPFDKRVGVNARPKLKY